MRVLSIAWKDFLHTYRNVAGLAMMFVAPLLLATALGAAFGSGDDFSIPAVKTVVANEDGGEASGDAAAAPKSAAGEAIVTALTSPELGDLLAVTEAESAQAAREAVDAGEAEAAVLIPAGMSAAVMSPAGGISSGGEDTDDPAADGAQVTIYRDPALTVGPAIVSAVVQSVVQTIEGGRAAAVAAAGLGVTNGLTDPQVVAGVAAQSAQEFTRSLTGEPPVSIEARAPVIPGGEDRAEPNIAGQVLLGMMVFFMLFGASNPAQGILEEHRTGTLSRLFTTPTPRSLILGGKYVAVFVIVLVQSVILLLAGRFLLGAHWGGIGPVSVMTLCGALVATSLGLLTVSFAKTPGQAGAVSSAIFVFLALIGGNFMGAFDVGGTAFALVRRFTPNGWLLEGWQNLLFGGSWGDIVLPALASLGFAVVFFALATFFFRRRYA